MSDMETANYTYEELSDKKRPDLNKLARKLKVQDLRGKNEDLIERMINKTKTVRCTWDSDGDLIAPHEAMAQEGAGKRMHPVLGEWKTYVIEAREHELVDETFANNHFSARIKMGEEVTIPEGFAKFIANSCYSFEHYYDETKMDPATGKMGLHTKRRISDFFTREV